MTNPDYSDSLYARAMVLAEPCDCGSTNLGGPPDQAVVFCGDCGRQGKPARTLDWGQAVRNWNTWPKVKVKV